MVTVPTAVQAQIMVRYIELAQAVIDAARPVVVQELPSVAAVSRLRLRMALDNIDSFCRTMNAELYERMDLVRCGGCEGVLQLNGTPRPPKCPSCGVSWTEKRT
jgi:hypothetical protein